MSADRWAFVLSAYGITVLALIALMFWVLTKRRQVKKDLANLEAAGIKRRSND